MCHKESSRKHAIWTIIQEKTNYLADEISFEKLQKKPYQFLDLYWLPPLCCLLTKNPNPAVAFLVCIAVFIHVQEHVEEHVSTHATTLVWVLVWQYVQVIVLIAVTRHASIPAVALVKTAVNPLARTVVKEQHKEVQQTEMVAVLGIAVEAMVVHLVVEYVL